MENKETALLIAREVKAICDHLNIEYIFKASYKKANRTSVDSFTGIGDIQALEYIKEIGEIVGVETITDVHESKDPGVAKDFVDNLQIPAFLCRQTDLLVAAGESGCGVNIKKGQFLSPEAMNFPLQKVLSTGNNKVWLCERGTTFGYNDLVVDATSIARMKQFEAPVIMDCTHATQKPNKTEGVTGGDPSMIETLALSAIISGADGLFIETHPEPFKAKSDAQCMLALEHMSSLLERVAKTRELHQSF
jgi:2-dehydro-3-deoxyphosphooctonate aldolase (KDO 8-P synthase)